eukprot:Opistho-1_new@91023
MGQSESREGSNDANRPLLDGADGFERALLDFQGFEVSVNVYDLIPANKYLAPLGLGAYHTGVVVHGEEYAYGFHKDTTSGIYMCDPKDADSWAPFRKTISVGYTTMSRAEIYILLRNMGETFTGNSYSIVEKNCNHFTQEFCRRLCTEDVSVGYLNRPARLGATCPCCVPVAWKNVNIEAPPIVENTTTAPTAPVNDAGAGASRGGTVTSQPVAISFSGFENEFGADWDFCSFPPPKRSGSRAPQPLLSEGSLSSRDGHVGVVDVVVQGGHDG